MATTITVKNIPSSLHNLLKERARTMHRSINSEILALMETTLKSSTSNPEELLAAARNLRERTKKGGINEKFLQQAKNTGRR